MRRLLWIIVLVMAMASAYAQVPQDSLEVHNDTLQVLVADSAGAFIVTDTIVEVEQPAVKEDTIQEKGHLNFCVSPDMQSEYNSYDTTLLDPATCVKPEINNTIFLPLFQEGVKLKAKH